MKTIFVKKQTGFFNKWFCGLPNALKDKIAQYIDRVLAGNTSNCAAVRDGISEIKINYQKGYRVYYTMSNETVIILLAGGDKSGNQKQQNKDIQKAIEIRNELRARGLI